MELVIDRFGRVVLPRVLRKDFNLHAGSRLLVKESGREIILCPEEDREPCVQKNSTLVFTGTATGDVAGQVARSRQEQLEKNGAM